MNTCIRATIRAFLRPEHRLSCPPTLWRQMIQELHRRGENRRESGAFLLGRTHRGRRHIERVAYYDDLDPASLDTGIVVFRRAGYEPLYTLCHELGLTVVADVHTHGGCPRQSETDRVHPMIPTSGHIGLIVPDFARRLVTPEDLGLYEYQGQHRWHDRGGQAARRFFYIGRI